MFIELLIVGAILMVLYSSGILQFGDPVSLFISIAIVITAGAAGFYTTHFVARRVVDSLFGIGEWTAGKPRKLSKLEQERADALAGSNLAALEKLVKEIPGDLELSRRLADFYWKRGETEKYIAEKKRILEAGRLTTEEACAIYNRLADLDLAANRADSAVEQLSKLRDRFPETAEAVNARKRIEVIMEKYSSAAN